MSKVCRRAWVLALCGWCSTAARADPIHAQGWTFWTPGSTSPATVDPPTPTPTASSSISSGAAPASAVSSTGGGTYDARIDLGGGPYPEAASLTTGGAQPWYDSPSITNLFGGTPSASQQAAFDRAILQRVEQTFQLSGVPINLTSDPNAPAAHTLSLVSNTTSTWGPVLGLTELTANGFSFIDQAAKSAQSVDQLEWIVAHNISHELMLAFGVGENYDTTGHYIDAKIASLSMMLDPGATFSSAAAQALLSQNFLANPTNTQGVPGEQNLPAQTVPEPAAVLFWGLGAVALVLARRKRQQSAQEQQFE